MLILTGLLFQWTIPPECALPVATQGRILGNSYTVGSSCVEYVSRVCNRRITCLSTGQWTVERHTTGLPTQTCKKHYRFKISIYLLLNNGIPTVTFKIVYFKNTLQPYSCYWQKLTTSLSGFRCSIVPFFCFCFLTFSLFVLCLTIIDI